MQVKHFEIFQAFQWVRTKNVVLLFALFIWVFVVHFLINLGFVYFYLKLGVVLVLQFLREYLVIHEFKYLFISINCVIRCNLGLPRRAKYLIVFHELCDRNKTIHVRDISVNTNNTNILALSSNNVM